MKKFLVCIAVMMTTVLLGIANLNVYAKESKITTSEEIQQNIIEDTDNLIKEIVKEAEIEEKEIQEEAKEENEEYTEEIVIEKEVEEEVKAVIVEKKSKSPKKTDNKITDELEIVKTVLKNTTPASKTTASKITVSKTTASKTTVNKTTVAKSYTNEELKLLACLVHAEAGSESYQGKLAVANVVLNRVKSSKYSHVNNINDVIYDKKWAVQFSVTVNGALKKQLSNYSNFNSSLEKESIKAAKAALEGENNIGTYLSFTRYSTYLANKYKNHEKIGGHIFY